MMATQAEINRWIDYVNRVQKAIGNRSPGDPVMTVVVNLSPRGIEDCAVHLIGFDLQNQHLVPVIGKLITKFEKVFPDMPEAVKLRDTFIELFAAKIDTQDISGGLQ